jgi:hypothetical protein
VKEIRAVVLGLFVVLLVLLALAVWRRPAVEFSHVRAYRVEVREKDGGSTRHVSFTIPTNLVARIAKLVPINQIGRDLRADWGRGGDVTPKDILDAAAASAPDKPGLIKRGDYTVEVTPDGPALEIVIKDNWDKTVKVRLPRAIVESFGGGQRITTRDILRKLDELGPGDVVVVKDRDKEVTITAEAR